MKIVSLVIPSCGHLENLSRLVDSISRQDVSLEYVEVLIILNNHKPADVGLLKNELSRFALNLQIYELQSAGVNKARNFGLKKAEGEIIFFVDDDCVLANFDVIGGHIQLHRSYPEVLAFGGGYRLRDKPGYFDRIYNLIQMRWFYDGFTAKKYGDGHATQQLLGGNFSIKRKISEANGMYFEEAIAYGSSEYDYFIQAQMKNLSLVAIEKELLHFTNENFKSVARKVFLQGRGKKILDKKYSNAGSSSNAGEELNISRSEIVLLKFYNYCYWYGYFYDESRLSKIVKLVCKDSFSYLNLQRYRILQKFQK